MIEFLSSILGEYSPPTYQAISTAYNSLGDVEVYTYDVIPSGLAGVDWLYVLGGVLFIVAVYSIFKLLGGLICKIS